MKKLGIAAVLALISISLISFKKEPINHCKMIDSIVDGKIQQTQIMKNMVLLFKDSKLIPCWNSNASIDFDMPSYSNYSLKKSLFKLDLIRLMYYYNCSPQAISYLKNIKGGHFTEYELMKIKERIKPNDIEKQDSIYMAELDTFFNYTQFLDYQKRNGMDYEKNYYIDTSLLE